MPSIVKYLSKINITIVVLMILVLAMSLVGQPANPPGFHRDEASIGYSAYSILKTGRDNWGQFLPLHFKGLGDYPPGIYNYLTVFWVALMGLTEVAVRMTGVTAAVLLVPLTYYLVLLMFRNKQLSLVTVFVMIFSPWFLVQARSGSEPLTALVFVFSGLLSLHRWLKTGHWRWAVLMALFYFGGLFTYNAVKAVLFLIQPLFIALTVPEKLRNIKVIAITILILIISYLSVYAIPGAAMNYSGGNIFHQVAAEDRTPKFTRESLEGVPTIFSRALHNKITDVVLTAVGATFTYLGTNFLFFGGGNPPRYVIPFTGQLLLVCLPFLLIGIFERSIIGQSKKKLLGLWLLIGVLPGVISINFFPHIKRTMFMYLPLYILIASGILTMIGWLKGRWRLIVVGLLILSALYNFGYFINNYYVHSRYETVYDRSYGYKEGFEKLKKHEAYFNQVEVYDYNESPDIFYLFFNRIDPVKVQSLTDKRTNMFDTSKLTWTIDNYTFLLTTCPVETELKPEVLYMTREDCIERIDESLYVKLDTVLMPDRSIRLMIFKAADSLTLRKTPPIP